MNNLKEYRNLYGLNFYMGNKFKNFEKEMPQEGFFLSAENDLERIKNVYKDQYEFKSLTSTEGAYSELRQKVVLCSFSTK